MKGLKYILDPVRKLQLGRARSVKYVVSLDVCCDQKSKIFTTVKGRNPQGRSAVSEPPSKQKAIFETEREGCKKWRRGIRRRNTQASWARTR